MELKEKIRNSAKHIPDNMWLDSSIRDIFDTTTKHFQIYKSCSLQRMHRAIQFEVRQDDQHLEDK